MRSMVTTETELARYIDFKVKLVENFNKNIWIRKTDNDVAIYFEFSGNTISPSLMAGTFKIAV